MATTRYRTPTKIYAHVFPYLMILALTLLSCQTGVNAGNAYLRYTYEDSATKQLMSETESIAQWGMDSSKRPQWGWLVHVKTTDDQNHACTPPQNWQHYRWVALIQRGNCKFEQKIHNAATSGNATAVIIYNNAGNSVVTMRHDNDNEVAVFLGQNHGEMLAGLVDSGVCVLVEIAASPSAMKDVDYWKEPGCRPTTPSPTTTTRRPDVGNPQALSSADRMANVLTLVLASMLVWFMFC